VGGGAEAGGERARFDTLTVIEVLAFGLREKYATAVKVWEPLRSRVVWRPSLPPKV
jgi:hypothetical protein